MIYIVLGTKAQVIKMGPVMAELTRRSIPYVYISTGQHKETIDDLLADFNVPRPDHTLYHGKDITRLHQVLPWMVKLMWKFLLNRKTIIRSSERKIFVVHGDTASTVLGALMGRFVGADVAHCESGLRSFNIFHPFPEELQRLATFRLSNIYFCPGKWALDNVASYSGEKINIHYNTLVDALQTVQSKNIPGNITFPEKKYCLISIHRFENIARRSSLGSILTLIERITQTIPGVFVLHPPTIKHLEKHQFMDRLKKNSQLELRSRSSYSEFIQLLKRSEFVVTDGGSNQEECAYLGHPCLLFRKVTERQDGLEKNVVISNFNQYIVDKFVKNYGKYVFPPLTPSKSPSKLIVDHLSAWQ
ncbi:UDP-N-acetylglucosamine 2-epimerase [Patescibacteria group bacterium]